MVTPASGSRLTPNPAPPNPASPRPTQTYDPRWFELIDSVEDKHFWFAARRRVIAALARRALAGSPDGATMLEIGCGNGGLLSTLQSACPRGRVIGMDLFPDGLRHARNRSTAALVLGDARRQPFGVPFQLIGLFDVIEHLPDDAGLLREVHAMLDRSGALLVTVPAHPSLWSEFDRAANHQRRYTVVGLRDTISAAGFRVAFLSQFMAPLLPIMWLKRRARESNPVDELRIVPGVNGMMNAILAIEGKLLGWGLKMPMGTSLIALAYKD
jgi:SAM-dependent methyltransferase